MNYEYEKYITDNNNILEMAEVLLNKIFEMNTNLKNI